MTTLHELANPELKITIRGKEYKLNPLDGYAAQLYEQRTEKNATEIACRIAARCLGLPFKEVFGSDEIVGFSPKDVARVIEIAAAQLEAVKATVPNDSQAVAAKDGGNPSPPSPQPIQLAS